MHTRIIYLFIIFLITAFTATGQTKPIEKDSVILNYNVYAGGMHALKASLDISMTKKDYDIVVNAKTNGFIGKIFPWKGHFETIGENTNDGFKPTKYVSSDTWKKKVKETRLEYKNGKFQDKYTVKNGKTTKSNKKVKDDLTRDTVDMLTGAIKLLQSTNGEKLCNSKVPVFDGKRRFNLVFKEVGKATINKNKYSTFSGSALKCTVEIEPVLGFKKKDQKRGWLAVQNHTKERKKLPTIWLSRLQENGPVVPVRMEIASSYGAVIAHLTSATNN